MIFKINFTFILLYFTGISLFVLSHKQQQYHSYLPQENINLRPIIGIFSQLSASPFPTNTAYLAASYVKYIESAGGRVVPIPFDASNELLDYLFDRINGFLVPGGSDTLDHSTFINSASHLFSRALKANDAGDYFPIWGTCLGFEALHVIINQLNVSVLSSFAADDISLQLNFTSQAPTSRLFSSLSKDVYTNLANNNITYNHHIRGVSPFIYKANKYIADFFNLLAISYDTHGKAFAAAIEGKKYPVYGSQFHPEKILFEWDPNLKIAHGDDALLASQQMANFFVNEARKNKHYFQFTRSEINYLIYNYDPIYVGDISSFQQIYVWDL